MKLICPPDGDPSGENIAVEQDYVPQVVKCLWFDDRAAAYTIAFDDARVTHHQVSAPALFERNMRGTFYLNTKDIGNWSVWQQVVDMGHEIGSHTWSHPKLPDLPEAQQRVEMERAIADISSHLNGIKGIPSFAYPYGLYNDALRKTIRDYHVSARGGGGLNSYDLSDEALTLVHGIGVYPPYNMDSIAGWVNKAIDQNAWIIVYFHSVSASGDSNDTTIPANRFYQHLDFVQGVRDSLWIAPQGEVSNYLRIRRDGQVKVALIDQTYFEISLENLPNGISDISSLTVKMTLPEKWIDQNIVLQKSDGSAQTFRKGAGNVIFFSVPRSGKIIVAAKKAK